MGRLRSLRCASCAVALLLAAGFLAGCGGDDNTTIVQPGDSSGGDQTSALKVASAVSIGNTEVLVTFTVPVSDSAADPSRYSISAQDAASPAFVAVQGAAVSPDRLRVSLTTLAQADIPYVVKVTNVEAAEGDPIDPTANTGIFNGTPLEGTAPDSDGDGLTDVNEQQGWTVTVFQANGTVINRAVTSSPESPDTDGDGVSDVDERRAGSDPRSADTDQDSLTDGAEMTQHFSSPTHQDSDGDGITDGDEVSRNHTSPLLADSDGDQYSDYMEIFERASHPLVADVPEARVEFAGDLDLRLNVQYTDGTSITTQEGTKLSRAETNSQSFTDTTVNQQTLEFGQKIGASSKEGLVGEVSAAQKFMFEESVAWTDTTSQEVRQESERIRSFGRDKTESASSGTIGMGLRIKNTGDVAFTLKNLVVSVLQRDPVSRRSFKTLATLNLNETLLGDGVTLGPFNGQTGVLQIANTEANAALVKDLLADPTGVVLEVGTFDLLDSEGRNFAFLSEVTNARTALITVDYGDGRVERYRVATGVRRSPDGTPAGISMGQALREILALDYATDRGEVLVGPDATPVVEQRLVRVKDVVTDEAAHRAWAVLGSRDELVAPGLDFDDILLKGGDSLFLAYITDVDGDGLSAREEFLHRTKDTEADTDGDGLTDFDEIKIGWTVTRDTVKTVYPDPLSADADRDGLTDLEERDLASGATDPLDPDTDSDGLCDGPGTPSAPADDVCRRSNRDFDPLEPRLTTPPFLLALTPEPADAAAPSDVPIDALFDQNMADNSRFTVYGLMSGIKGGVFGFGSARTTLRFTPTTPFLPGEEVSVRLTASVRNVDGIPLDPLVFRYRAAATDTGSEGFFAAPTATVAWASGFGLLEQVDVATADFDADGWPDVALTDPQALAVNVLLGSGDGHLAQPVRYGTGSSTPVAVAAADLDGDSDVDLAVATRNPGTVRVLLNTGTGILAPFGVFPIGEGATAIAAADLNGDGLPDLSVTEDAAGALTVLRNQGDRTFAPAPSVIGLDSPNDVAAADLNGDGRVDLVVSGEVPAPGGFGVPTGHVYVLLTDLGTGTPILTETHDIAEGAAHAIVAVDLTGDTFKDIAVTVDTFDQETGQGGYVATLANLSGGGVFAPPLVQALPPVVTGDTNDRTWLGLSAADFDGDGITDLAVSNDGNAVQSQAVRFLPGEGDGAFGAPFDIANIPGPGHLVAVDLDGDARPDLAFAAFQNEGTFDFNNGTVDVLLNRGPTGMFGFSRPPVSPHAASVPQLVPADMDGDGDVDVAALGTLGGDLVIHINDGTGALRVDSTVAIPLATWVTAADLNGNGLPDLAVGVASVGDADAELQVLLNLGNGRFTAPVAYAVGAAGQGQVSAARVAAGDWDGDGDTDLAFLGSQAALNLPDQVVPMMNVGGGFQPGTAVSVPVAEDASRLYAADVTGAGGAVDLLVTTTGTGNEGLRLFLGDGAGGFAPGQMLSLPAVPREVAVGDLDRDLDQDLVVSLGGPTGGALVFINQGDLFVEGGALSPGTDGDAVTLADVDGDGDLDAILVQGGDATVHLNDGAARFGPPERYMAGANAGPGNVAAADIDGDGDLDLLVPVSGGLALVENRLP